MRYFVQFIIPALLLLWVVYLLARKRSAAGDGNSSMSDRGTFLAILTIGATLAFGLGYLLYEFAP